MARKSESPQFSPIHRSLLFYLCHSWTLDAQPTPMRVAMRLPNTYPLHQPPFSPASSHSACSYLHSSVFLLDFPQSVVHAQGSSKRKKKGRQRPLPVDGAIKNNTGTPAVEWACAACTYMNPSMFLSCEICATPRASPSVCVGPRSQVWVGGMVCHGETPEMDSCPPRSHLAETRIWV